MFKTALIATVVPFLFTGYSFAAVLDANFIKENIEKNIKNQLESITTGDIKVDVNKVPYQSINVKDGIIDFNVNINLRNISSRTVARVEVLSDGQQQRAFGVPVDIEIQDYVWVAKESIYKGKALNSSNVKLEKKDITKLFNRVLKQNFNYRKAYTAKNFRAGKF